jgi:arylsulfatase A-like enzyme
MITREALKWIEKHAFERPWFLIVSYPDPHAPTAPLERLAAMYDPKTISLPPNVHSHVETSVPWYNDWPSQRRYTDEALRLFLARYYALVSHVDEGVGKVVAALEKRNLLDETIVVFAGDQGEMAGEHGCVGKGPFFYEAEARFPLIVRYPKLIPRDEVITSLVSQVDIMPTLLDLADVPIPIPVQGVSQADVLVGEKRSVRDACFGEIRISKFVRTGDYSLTYYGAKGGQLYDLAKDPHELRNVFDDPAYARVRRELIDKLFEWCLHKEDTLTPIGYDWSKRMVKEREGKRQGQKVHHPGLSIEPAPGAP